MLLKPGFFYHDLDIFVECYAFSDFVHLVSIDYCYKQYSKLLRDGVFG